ncbi:MULTISPECIES: hypothetical protein [Empedobacter]|uniref:Uncharacterized protein n=1 Tax=Empedobacter falsenii TaxID=343874 RepID=A0A376J3B7_9FLAO|nr:MULTISPECIES: hypothetical protein [Empedobacter]MDH1602224.1 hypothetical protein [Empedobacter sp. GD03739]MDH1882060.1 hypothetical protein [Empedobacter sp. GD03797]MDH2207856.1 hypothetical protein [Empedobacter sp. GD03644]QLL59544.1 hypothetical protein FH779_16285 [Empedobacter falsenii]STE54905.1 Uncharacterised protein [Empedobacter falsenii]
MKNNDKISNYIKDDLENRELNPSHDAWDRIQARMDVAPSPQKSNFKWWLSAAVVALFTVSTSIYLFSNQSKDDQPKEFVNHQEQNNPQQIQSDSNTVHSSESILANNEKIDSSKKEVEIQTQEEKKPIQHGKVQVAINEESQQVEMAFPTKKEAIVEKKEDLKSEAQPKKNIAANTTLDSVKVNKKNKNFVDPNMLLYSIENKENLKESNQSRVVSIGFK